MASRRTDEKVDSPQGDQYVRAYGFPDHMDSGVHAQSGAASPTSSSHRNASHSTPGGRNCATSSHMTGHINAAMPTSGHVLGGTSSPGYVLRASLPPCSTSTPAQHPVSQEENHDIPGRHQILESEEPLSEATAALQKLQKAPSISSLPSQEAAGGGTPHPQGGASQKKYNFCVASAGCESLSTASALLQQLSLDSGSLTGAAKLQNGQNQCNLQSHVSTTLSSPATGINTIEDKQVESKMLNVSLDENVNEPLSHSSTPVSSYLGITQSDFEERFADLVSVLTNKRENMPSNNDLDVSGQGRQWRTDGANLPKNISDPRHSISLNEDLSLTAQKTVTKSTQTEPPAGQDQEGCGGAASAELGVQTMASGSSSSLPPEGILVRKLKRPIIQWLQRKLETPIGAAWQDLVDLHDWDYDRITDFENHCANSTKSPFCMLLAESEFQMYRLCDLKKDLFRLPRKDVLHDLDGVMAKYYK